MNKTYEITFEPNARAEDIQILGDGIMTYAKQQKDQDPLDFFAFFIRDETGKIRGGCNGCTLYGSLYIDQLWVEDSLRNLNYGTELITSALQFGVQHKCTFATVNTMSWEALDFYKKMGFEIEFVRGGFKHDSSFYFLRRTLQQS